MTAHGIAQRLLAKHGQQDAIQKVEAQLWANSFAWDPTNAQLAAKLGAYRMLWSAVRYHLDLGPA